MDIIEILARAVLEYPEWDESDGHCRYCGKWTYGTYPPEFVEDHAPDCVVLVAERVVKGGET